MVRPSGGLRVVAPVLLGMALLTVWQAVVRAGLVSEFLLPSPSSFGSALWRGVRYDALLSSGAVTLVESFAGSVVGGIVALPLGYAIARSRLVAVAMQPYVAASMAVPAVALAPLLALWLGYGLVPVVCLCAFIVFFPMVVNTVLGLQSLDPDVMEAARVEGAGALRLLWHIELPLALPSVLAGVRTSVTLSVSGAVVGEFVMGGQGLGELLVVQRSYSDTSGVFATMAVLVALAVLFYGSIRLIENRVVRQEEN